MKGYILYNRIIIRNININFGGDKKVRKKIAGIIVVGALLTMSTTAFAHGHGGRHHSRTNRTYSVCSVDGCDLTYNHSHNGTVYAGHHNGDGHGHCY